MSCLLIPMCYFVITLHLLSTFSSHSCSYYVPWSEYWQWNGELQLWLDYSLWLRHSCHIHLQCWLFPEWSSHQDLWWRWVLCHWILLWSRPFLHTYVYKAVSIQGKIQTVLKSMLSTLLESFTKSSIECTSLLAVVVHQSPNSNYRQSNKGLKTAKKSLSTMGFWYFKIDLSQN